MSNVLGFAGSRSGLQDFDDGDTLDSLLASALTPSVLTQLGTLEFYQRSKTPDSKLAFLLAFPREAITMCTEYLRGM